MVLDAVVGESVVVVGVGVSVGGMVAVVVIAPGER